MCALCAHREETAKEAESREVADTSCAFQLTVLEKCCNITKVVVGKPLLQLIINISFKHKNHC